MPNLDADKAKLAKYTQKLGGKTYLTVAGRVFAAHDSRQLVSITTELHETEKHYRYVATAKVLNTHLPDFAALPDDAKVGTFTGMSQSVKVGGRSAEGTNPLEVAETSAVGRALGFAGFGDLESIASFEEVAVAVSRGGGAGADDDAAPTEAQKKQVFALAKNVFGITTKEQFDAKVRDTFGKETGELTAAEVAKWVAKMEKDKVPF